MGGYFIRREQGFTIIETMLFFGITGALLLGILGTASVGVNTQRYSDAVNTFTSIVQQEFTNVTNVVNDRSIASMCGGSTDAALTRGTTNCVIIGRLMTVDSNGDILRANIVGTDPGTTPAATDLELDVVRDWNPRVDVASQELSQMNWGTTIQKSTAPGGSNASLLIVRSPRSGNLFSYVVQSPSAVVTNVQDMIDDDIDVTQNSRDQVMCIDRAGWVATPVRAVKLSPYTSGPSGVTNVEAEGAMCA